MQYKPITYIGFFEDYRRWLGGCMPRKIWPEAMNSCMPHFFVISSSGTGTGSGSYSGSPTTTSTTSTSTSVKKNDNDGCNQEWLYKDLGSLEESVDDFPPMMVASCHGIICLHYKVPRDIALWNPATKQYRILPKSLPLPSEEEFGRPLDDNDFVGFGFDTQTKDYKVLLITCYESNDYFETKKKNAVQVYTLRTNCWRWCPHVDLPTYNRAYPPNQGFYRNGHYFFLAAQFYKTSDYDDDGDVKIGIKEVMISFDFSKETYRIIPIPNDGNIRLDIRRRDAKIVCVTAVQDDDCKCQVYVLNDDVDDDDDDDTTNDEEYSWTKLYETYLYQPHSIVGPMAISKDGLCGILRGSDGYGLMSYNFETEEKKDIQIANDSFADLHLERVQMYKESLVSIYPPHHDDTTTF